MKKFLLILSTSLMIFSFALADVLDHYEHIFDASSQQVQSPKASVVIEDQIALLFDDTYKLEVIETGYLWIEQPIPNALTGMKAMDYDGIHIYGVLESDQGTCVYRWNPENINSYELVTEVGQCSEAIAVDPDTKDIYLISIEAELERLNHYNSGEYSREHLADLYIYHPKGLAWLPNAELDRNLVIASETGANNDPHGTKICFLNPDSPVPYSVPVEIYPPDDNGGGEPLGLSITRTYNPEYYLIATTILNRGVDLWMGDVNEGTGDLTVLVVDQLRSQYLAGADITVTNSAGEVEGTGTSDQNGAVRIEGINVGIKTISASKEGFTINTVEARVLNDESRIARIELLPPYGGYGLNGGCGSYTNIHESGERHEITSENQIVEYQLSQPFEYYGTEYNTIYISVNGIFTFDADTPISGTQQAIPNTDAPNNFVAPLWCSCTATGNNEDIFTEHSVDNLTRISWWVSHNDMALVFQVCLDHNNNTFSVFYSTSYSWPTDAVVGIENPDGTDGLTYNHQISDGRQWGAGFVVNDVDEPVQTIFPAEFNLISTYPNPFNPTATALVTLPSAGKLDVVLYNMLGQKVAEIANGFHQAGTHQMIINGNNLTSGTYFIRANVAGKYDQTQKITLIK